VDSPRAAARTPTAPASPARGESGPADGSSPHPGLMLMRWDAEANLNCARSPGHRMADDELLNPVFPRDPGGDPHRLTHRVHAGVGELLRRERPRLPSSPTRHLSHDVNTIEQTYEPRQECTTAYRVVASRCRRCHPSGSARQHRWLALIPPTAVYGIGTVGTVRVQRSWIAASGRQATLAVSVARNGRRGTRSRIVVAGSPSGRTDGSGLKVSSAWVSASPQWLRSPTGSTSVSTTCGPSSGRAACPRHANRQGHRLTERQMLERWIFERYAERRGFLLEHEPSGRWARGSGRSGSTMPVDRPQEDEARAETGQ
jgi:hypothetical protein